MIRRVVVPMLLCCLPAAQACPEQAASQSSVTATSANATTLERAKEEIRKGEFDKAIVALRELAATNQKSTDVFHQLGLAYYKHGNMAEAEQAFAKAIELDPDDREAVQLRGLALYRTGRPTQAIPLLERVRQWLPPGASDVNYILGLCYTDAARYDEARKSFALQYQLEPESAAAYLIAGNLFLRARLAPAAEAAGRKALQLDPRLALAHYLLGETALFQEDVPKAMAEFEQERQLNPGYGRVYDRLGDAYMRQGRYDEAQAALNRSIILDPASTGPYIQLGKLALRRSDPLTAEMYLTRAEKMDPGNYITHALLGQAFRALGRAEEASREAKAAEGLQDTEQPKPESPH